MALTNARASSSRRAPARVQSTPPADDDSGDERRSKPVPRRGANGDGGGEAGEGGEEDQEGWTVDTYQPQPLRKDEQGLEYLRKAAGDLDAMLERIHGTIERTKETAVVIEGNSPGDTMIEELAQSVCRSIEIKAVLEIKRGILGAISSRLGRGEELEDAVDDFERRAADKTEDYMRKTARQKFADEEEYINFRKEIWDVNHARQACWPMTHWLEREPGDESEGDDDEVQVGPTMQNYKCAATNMAIKDAMLNPECGHHYSKAAIDELFQQRHIGRGANQRIRCPAVGCSKMVLKNALEADEEYQSKADEFYERVNEEEVHDFEDITQE